MEPSLVMIASEKKRSSSSSPPPTRVRRSCRVVPSLQLFCVFAVHQFFEENNISLSSLPCFPFSSTWNSMISDPPPKIRKLIESVCPLCLGFRKVSENNKRCLQIESIDGDVVDVDIERFATSSSSSPPVVDFDSRQFTKAAVASGHQCCLLFFIENGFSCDLKECIVSAAHHGYVDVFNVLLDKLTDGGKKNVDSETMVQIILETVIQSQEDIFYIWVDIPPFLDCLESFDSTFFLIRQWI